MPPKPLEDLVGQKSALHGLRLATTKRPFFGAERTSSHLGRCTLALGSIKRCLMAMEKCDHGADENVSGAVRKL